MSFIFTIAFLLFFIGMMYLGVKAFVRVFIYLAKAISAVLMQQKNIGVAAIRLVQKAVICSCRTLQDYCARSVQSVRSRLSPARPNNFSDEPEQPAFAVPSGARKVTGLDEAWCRHSSWSVPLEYRRYDSPAYERLSNTLVY